jgi:methylated-DNA-[protein]-cysteine S-methyltransferase
MYRHESRFSPLCGKERIMETTSSITAGHAVLETVIGFMGIAWSEKGLIRLCLPERSREAVERRLMRHAGVSASTAQPPWVVELIASIKAYAAGEDVDFSSVPVDLDGVDDFRLAIYDAARKLSYGETST